MKREPRWTFYRDTQSTNISKKDKTKKKKQMENKITRGQAKELGQKRRVKED